MCHNIEEALATMGRFEVRLHALQDRQRIEYGSLKVDAPHLSRLRQAFLNEGVDVVRANVGGVPVSRPWAAGPETASMPLSARNARTNSFSGPSKGVIRSTRPTPRAFNPAIDASNAVVTGMDTLFRMLSERPGR